MLSTFHSELAVEAVVDHCQRLRPVAMYNDPYRREPNKLVLCETYNADGSPNRMNFRYHANKVFQLAEAEKPWFGLEQEYTLLGADGRPYGWPTSKFPCASF